MTPQFEQLQTFFLPHKMASQMTPETLQSIQIFKQE